MTCQECEKIKQRKNVIYEDNIVYAMLVEKPSVQGHIAIFPKEHYPIIEKIPSEIFEHMIVIANKISSVCFETLNAQGTNILIRNGLAAGQRTNHSQIHILPRFENDGLNLQWQPIKISEEELSTVELTLKTELEKPEEKKIEKKEEVKKEEPVEEIAEEDNYLLKQLNRIP
jgi:histidine triad (HIT) family protein